jgi:FAD:protein FMN transferase
MSLERKSWKALGTSVHLLTTEPVSTAAAEAAVRAVLEDIDATCSRFRADSELSKVNASAGRPVRVSPLFGGAIAAALRAARLTDGAVDPTIGTAIRLAGYDDDFGAIAANGGPLTLRAYSVRGWEAVRFYPASRMLMLPRGVELDLGSTGKALAADLAASAAQRAAAGGGVLVSLGGDIATAGASPDGGWRILVAEDSRLPPDSDGQVICIGNGAVATSSTTVRRWRRGAQLMHHIIDPRTSLPSRSRWRTVTVLAANCVEANTAATAAIVQGDEAVDWLSARRLPARLVENDGTIHFIGTWPAPISIAPLIPISDAARGRDGVRARI